MRKIISIAIFGDSTRKDGSGVNYHEYLPTFVLAHSNLFPADEGWELRVHADDALPSRWDDFLLDAQHRKLLQLTRFCDPILTKAMLWRMTPVFEDGIDYVFCRDVDALPMPRERRCCDVFIASACTVHTIHDSQSHAGMMGGLCGFKAKQFCDVTFLDSLEDLYSHAAKTREEWALHGTDQNVLNHLIDRPHAGLTLLEHRYNGWHEGPGKNLSRAAGTYRCRAKSTPVPNVGKSRLTPEVSTMADKLANHMGSAGYGIGRAWTFWQERGDQDIAKAVAACVRP